MARRSRWIILFVVVFVVSSLLILSLYGDSSKNKRKFDTSALVSSLSATENDILPITCIKSPLHRGSHENGSEIYAASIINNDGIRNQEVDVVSRENDVHLVGGNTSYTTIREKIHVDANREENYLGNLTPRERGANASHTGTTRRQLQGMSFFLVNAKTGQDITKLTNGKIVDVSKSGTTFTIRIGFGSSNSIQSVVIDFDGLEKFGIDSSRPYALAGTLMTGVPRLSLNGKHYIKAQAKPFPDGRGVTSARLEMSFTITKSSVGLCEVDAPDRVPNSIRTDVPAYKASKAGYVNGQKKQWHKITIGFRGPQTCERANLNPFTDYRLEVTFTQKNRQKKFKVPGYYAADGNAANTGATRGDVWLVHFTPDNTGKWNWVAKFKKGTNVAQNGGGTGVHFDGKEGSFVVSKTDKKGRDHRRHGRLRYVEKHHLKFAGSKKYFLKAGADSPENFLAYEDFDATTNVGGYRKSWWPHRRDYKNGQPTWRGGRGTEITGAINYLSSQGMNVFSFLTLSLEGDDGNISPFISWTKKDRTRIDVSKTAQWEVLFEHADHMGMYLHFKTQETENDHLLDGGGLGPERKLYYRELIARFGHHHALNWNIGEENTNTPQKRKAFAQYFKDVDPYDHPVVIHSNKPLKQDVYPGLLGLKTYTGASLQSHFENVFSDTSEWVKRSAAQGQKWVVAVDESGQADKGTLPDREDPRHDEVRKMALWGNIMAGGAGVELYFGYSYGNSDLTCQDFRSRSNMWAQARHALSFFEYHSIPFWDWDLKNKCKLVQGTNIAWCQVDTKRNYYVVYLRNGGAVALDTRSSPNGAIYSVKWYDPRNGGNLKNGSITSIMGGKKQASIGTAPKNTGSTSRDDWVVLIRKKKKR